jgi:putative oxidoreductase
VLNWPLSIRLAFYLPWLEIFCGLALIFGRLRVGAVTVLLALTVIFIAVSVAALLLGIDINCGCFGSAGKGLSFTWHMLIDFAILGGLLALCFSPLAFRPAARV